MSQLGPRLLAWLKESEEPSVRYRVLTELEGRSADDAEVRAVRAEIGKKGWAAQILDLQLPAANWTTPGTSDRDVYVPKYVVTNWQLLVLSDLGLSAGDSRVRAALELMWSREGHSDGGIGGKTSEVCFTGNALRLLARLGDPDDPRLGAPVDWLVAAQKADGGWHCFPSESGTLDCWEALAGFEALPRSRWTDAVRRAVERGVEFYLSRGLLREGSRPYAPWYRTHYPIHYYYDFLVGLDVLTRLGYGRDPRLVPALELLESKRNPDGSWDLDAAHPDLDTDLTDYSPRTPMYPYLLELPGRPSRWITITAIRVLTSAGRA